MSLSKHTKAQLIDMLAEKGISAKSSLKKDELIALLETANSSNQEDTGSIKTADTQAEHIERIGKSVSETAPGAAAPVLLVICGFIALAFLAWVIL